MPRKYYALVAGLPDISIEDEKLTFSQLDFRNELQEVIHPNDFELVKLLFFAYDNQNLLNLLEYKDKAFDEKGIFSRAQLEEEITNPLIVPDYMQVFINHYKEKEAVFPKLSWEDQLTSLYYNYAIQCDNQFVSDWFQFDLDLNNIITGMNCRKHELVFEEYLIGTNDVVSSIIAKNTRDFGLIKEFPLVERILYLYDHTDFYERENEIDRIRWNYLSEQTFFHYFTIERIIAFVIKLGMIERWFALDREKGKQLLDELIQELHNSYKFPEEFKI